MVTIDQIKTEILTILLEEDKLAPDDFSPSDNVKSELQQRLHVDLDDSVYKPLWDTALTDLESDGLIEKVSVKSPDLYGLTPKGLLRTAKTQLSDMQQSLRVRRWAISLLSVLLILSVWLGWDSLTQPFQSGQTSTGEPADQEETVASNLPLISTDIGEIGVGDYVWNVNPDRIGEVNLRSTFGHWNKSDQDVLAEVHRGVVMLVIDGPESKDDLTWWKVQIEGWMAETGSRGGRLLEPVEY